VAVSWQGRRRLLLITGLAAVLAGCALPPASPPPRAEDLPFQGFDQGLVLRWRIDQAAGQARIVGLADAQGRNFAAATLEVLGLDARRAIVSRAQTGVRPTSFAAAPVPFEVVLKTTGQEAAFELRVIDLRMENQRGGAN
jgi:hypothetical protein